MRSTMSYLIFNFVQSSKITQEKAMNVITM